MGGPCHAGERKGGAMHKRILVTLDGSELAEMVIPHVEVVAEPGYSEVILLQVAPEAEVLIESGVVVAYADQEDADPIAMTTHGRSGVQRLFYGSVAEEVLRGAAVPILLVRGGTSG